MTKNERPFEGVLGNTVQLRILENLIANGPARFNKKEIGDAAGVARASADKVIDQFLEWGILRASETHGRMTLYELDFDSVFVKCMSDFNWALLVRMCPELEKEVDAADQRMAPSHHDELVAAKKSQKKAKVRT